MKGSVTINESAKDVENNGAVDGKKPFIPLRWILVITFFFTYFAMFFARNSCAVALVVMVNSTKDESELDNVNVCPLALNQSEEVPDSQHEAEFDWSASDQGIILSTFFWGIVISKIFGSRFVEVVGQRLFVGGAISIGAILQFLSPLASKWDPLALATVNFLEGCCYGPVASALYSLLAVWAPSTELSSMTATMQAGGVVGVIAGVGISGWLAENVGWRSVFWLGAGVSVIHLPFWVLIKTVPWLKMLKSPFLYICILGLFARSWTEVLFTSGGPTFLSKTIGLTLSRAGLVSSMRGLSGLITMMIYGRIADILVKRSYVRKRTARKIFHFVGAGGMSITLIAIALAGCDHRLVIGFWILNGILSSGSTLSYSVSVIDFAPNYAGTLIGLTGLGNLGSALVPIAVASIVQKTHSWNASFYLASGISVISCIVFVLFMTDKPQSWNFQDEETNES